METATATKLELKSQVDPAALEQPSLHNVFVYGTLLSGEPNNVLLESAKLLGKATTKPFFRMFSNGWFPYMTLGYESETNVIEGYPIYGELWQVDDHTLGRLDRLEGVPHHYRRETINVTLDSDGSVRPTFVYLYYGSTSQLEEIESGNWKKRQKETREWGNS